jgi:hypothetical protein
MGTYGMPADSFAQERVSSPWEPSPAPEAAAAVPQPAAPQPAALVSASPAGGTWEAPAVTVLPLRA